MSADGGFFPLSCGASKSGITALCKVVAESRVLFTCRRYIIGYSMRVKTSLSGLGGLNFSVRCVQC